QPLAELLDTSLKTLRINRLRRNLRDRRIRRSLNRVVQQTGVDGDTALHILVVLPQALADRFLTGTVGVTDRQPPGVLDLRDVTLDDTEHLGTLVRLHPLLDLVQDHQSGPVTLQTRWRASHTLNQPASQSGVDNRLINIKLVLRSQLLRSQSRKHSERVLRLTLRHRSNLHPRLVVRFTNRHPVLIEMRKHDRPAKIRERYSGEQRVLTPPLAPPQHTIPVDELPMLIDGVPPHQEAALLIRRLERLTSPLATRHHQVLIHPLDDLIPERPIRFGEPKASRTQLLPRRTDNVTWTREEIGSIQLRTPYTPRAPGPLANKHWSDPYGTRTRDRRRDRAALQPTELRNQRRPALARGQLGGTGQSRTLDPPETRKVPLRGENHG